MNRPYFAPENPENGMEKCSPCEPNRRKRPEWCGEADTTPVGAHWDAHKPCPAFYDDPCYIPPVPYTPGYTNAQQIDFLTSKVNDLIKRTNEMIDQTDKNNHKLYGAYSEIVNSAVCNDAYYREITIEDGVLDGGSKYKVTHIPFLDRAGQPIYLELGLAYHNTTNSGIKEDAFHASQDTLADVLIPAMAPQTSWYGRAIYNKAPLPTYEPTDTEATAYTTFAPKDNKYTMAVLENGFLHNFLSTATADEMHNAKVRNAMGVESVLVSDGEYTADMCYDTSSITAHVAIGMNFTTKERFIIVVDGSDVSGCTTEALANLFIKYGCDIAFDLCSGINSFGMDMGGFMYNPEVASSDDTPSVPEMNCYWYITKRRHYHNDYVKDMAYLIQKVSEDNFRNYILNAQADYLKEATAQLRADLTTETEERKSADDTLDQKIDAEVVTLNERIDSEVKALEAADEQLQKNIDAEAAARKAADEQLQTNIDNEATTRANADTAEATARANADTQLQKNIDAEASAREEADTQLQTALNLEISNRQAADTNLADQISDETEARKAADTALQNAIDAEEAAREAAVTAEATARKNADEQLQTNIDNEATTRANADTAEATARANADTQLQKNIDAEASAREEADTQLQTALNLEISNRQAADTNLADQISDETEARKAADTALQNAIDAEEAAREAAVTAEATARKNADDAEATARETADNGLQAQIDTEVTARTQADSNLKTLIEAETEARTTNDTALNTRVDGLKSTVDTLQTTVEEGQDKWVNKDGSVAMEADLDVGGYNVDNVGSIVGSNLSGSYAQVTLNASSDDSVAIQVAKYASDGSDASTVEVVGVATPTTDDSAANKGYVDNNFVKITSNDSSTPNINTGYALFGSKTESGIYDAIVIGDTYLNMGPTWIDHEYRGMSVSVGNGRLMACPAPITLKAGDTTIGRGIVHSNFSAKAGVNYDGLFAGETTFDKDNLCYSASDMKLAELGVATPTVDMSAANKLYVDTAISGIDLSGYVTTDSLTTSLADYAKSEDVTTEIATAEASANTYTDTKVGDYLPLSGGTMSGVVRVKVDGYRGILYPFGAGINADGYVTSFNVKQELIMTTYTGSDTYTGSLFHEIYNKIGDGYITNGDTVYGFEAAAYFSVADGTLAYIQLQSNIATAEIGDLDNVNVHVGDKTKVGDVIIRGVADPENNEDCANKAYVDSKLATAQTYSDTNLATAKAYTDTAVKNATTTVEGTLTEEVFETEISNITILFEDFNMATLTTELPIINFDIEFPLGIVLYASTAGITDLSGKTNASEVEFPCIVTSYNSTSREITLCVINTTGTILTEEITIAGMRGVVLGISSN